MPFFALLLLDHLYLLGLGMLATLAPAVLGLETTAQAPVPKRAYFGARFRITLSYQSTFVHLLFPLANHLRRRNTF
jgi:hypothetical protein